MSILLAIHVAAFASLWMLALSIWISLLLCVLLAIHLTYQLGKVRLVSSDAVREFTFEAEGLVLGLSEREKITGTLRASTLVTPWLLVLNVSPANSRWERSVLILNDSLDKESFRKLRVFLRWQGAL